MEVDSAFYFGIVGILLFALELFYFRLAANYSIIDKPNERSSHINPVIRGGGIIFALSVLVWSISHQFAWPWLTAGVCTIAIISFLDDVVSLNPTIRSIVQLIAILLLFYQLWPIDWPPYLLLLAVVMCVGTLNAFNFMDGINGITGVYALVTLGSFFYVHFYIVPFTEPSLITVVAISILVFLFFNFRTRAKCFAGDVGSVTIAFILIFLLIQLIVATNNFLWPMLFLVYGIDSIVTIVYRIKRRENIFKPHRTHLYQYLSNELKWPHLIVSIVYGLVQLFINLILFFTLDKNQYTIPILIVLFFVLAYLLIKARVVNHIAKSN
jgi:UDP-N-acetylmuramyl pentapeptide phosphotransferase/UDP-N-acetylglucosamine-1-phosphate transferase